MLYLQLFRDNRRKKQQKNNKNKEECREEMFKEGKKDINSMKPIKLLNPVLISVSFILLWLPFVIVEILKTAGIFAKDVSLSILVIIKLF